MKSKILFTATWLLLASTYGCTMDADNGKGAEESAFDQEGKDDSFRSPTEHGALQFASQLSAGTCQAVETDIEECLSTTSHAEGCLDFHDFDTEIGPCCLSQAEGVSFWEDLCQHIEFSPSDLPSAGATANDAEFSDDELFHSWTFELTADATISLRTQIDELSEEPDTVMYLYRRDPGENNWGQNIAKNDDHDGNLWSQIDIDVGAGEYRIKVKAYQLDMRGPFSVAASCMGDGCGGDIPTAGEILAIEEFSAADFDCDDELVGAFPSVSPDYIFVVEENAAVKLDFSFSKEATSFATGLSPSTVGFDFETQTIDSNVVEGLALTISGSFYRIEADELIESDQPPVGVAIRYQYDRNDGSSDACELELISGLRF